jgi:hypothetical protein
MAAIPYRVSRKFPYLYKGRAQKSSRGEGRRSQGMRYGAGPYWFDSQLRPIVDLRCWLKYLAEGFIDSRVRQHESVGPLNHHCNTEIAGKFQTARIEIFI